MAQSMKVKVEALKQRIIDLRAEYVAEHAARVAKVVAQEKEANANIKALRKTVSDALKAHAARVAKGEADVSSRSKYNGQLEVVTKVKVGDLKLDVYPSLDQVNSNYEAVLAQYDKDLAALELCATDTLTINATSQFGRYV